MFHGAPKCYVHGDPNTLTQKFTVTTRKLKTAEFLH